MVSALVALLLLSADPAGDVVYTWTDADGSAHYTNDVDSIPARYREKARTLDGQPVAPKELTPTPPAPPDGKPAQLDEAQKPAARPAAEEPLEESAPAPLPLSAKEAAALDEAGWRKRFVRSTERVHRAEVNLTRDQEQLKRIANEESSMVVDAYGRTMSAGRAGALRQQLAEDERVLNEAREALHDLERLAADEAIPLEWRR